jgi:hypothetical protein
VLRSPARDCDSRGSGQRRQRAAARVGGAGLSGAIRFRAVARERVLTFQGEHSRYGYRCYFAYALCLTETADGGDAPPTPRVGQDQTPLTPVGCATRPTA